MKKGKKWSFWIKKTCFLAEFSLAELGGIPLPPLTENHPAQKPLAERGSKRAKISVFWPEIAVFFSGFFP